jgi:hypothetical protein
MGNSTMDDSKIEPALINSKKQTSIASSGTEFRKLSAYVWSRQIISAYMEYPNK